MMVMEKTILKMQENLKPGCYVAFFSATDESRFVLGKSDEFIMLDNNAAAIRKENGLTRIINLNFIAEIHIVWGLY